MGFGSRVQAASHRRCATLVLCCGMLAVVGSASCRESTPWTAEPRGRLWTTVPLPPTMGRIESVSFPTPELGWMVSASGEILHTENGGDTWMVQARGRGVLRSVDFLTERLGFAGTVDGTLYRTSDGGSSWSDITAALPEEPAGFCGITHVGSKLHAVGRYTGSVADYFWSDDSGSTWQYRDLSDIADALVDVLFLDSEVGLIGGMALSDRAGTGPALILRTVDGGSEWKPVFVHDGGRGFAWKLFAVSTTTIYAALQSEDRVYRMAKSTDGGSTWSVQVVAKDQGEGPAVQAVGFLNNSVGWVAGNFPGMFETSDGGLSWRQVLLTEGRVNRFVKVGSTLVTASPRAFLRLDPSSR